ncbi:unnamed protein product [Diamesa tonsa]
MFKIIIFCIALISLISYVKGETSNIMSVQVREQFEKESVVPDILDDYPVSVLNVSYTSGVKADLGNVLTPTQVKDQPTIQWEAKENSFYTLLMTDPDASSRAEPKFREVRHWLVVNIKGSDVSSGETKFQFVGTGAPKGSGLHRYVFLLFEQLNGKQEFDLPIVTNRSREGRLSTNTRNLIKDYNLRLEAGNFYQAEWDEYVPILQAQLSGN